MNYIEIAVAAMSGSIPFLIWYLNQRERMVTMENEIKNLKKANEDLQTSNLSFRLLTAENKISNLEKNNDELYNDNSKNLDTCEKHKKETADLKLKFESQSFYFEQIGKILETVDKTNLQIALLTESNKGITKSIETLIIKMETLNEKVNIHGNRIYNLEKKEDDKK